MAKGGNGNGNGNDNTPVIPDTPEQEDVKKVNNYYKHDIENFDYNKKYKLYSETKWNFLKNDSKLEKFEKYMEERRRPSEYNKRVQVTGEDNDTMEIVGQKAPIYS